MKKYSTIFSEGSHTWAMIARDPDRPDYLIDTNEYLVSDGSETLLTDPGGSEIFPEVFSAIASGSDPRLIKKIFASHQDPDIISSLALWLELNPSMRCYVSWMWSSFIPHFGGDDTTIISIPDEGQEIRVGSLSLQAIPAHHLHSAGNFHLYDPVAKLLFSGDVGAALLPEDQISPYVQNFDQHITHAKGFHQRWMGSNAAKRRWCERVAEMDIDMMCPQHGAIYKGADVERFINWFDELEVGVY